MENKFQKVILRKLTKNRSAKKRKKSQKHENMDRRILPEGRMYKKKEDH